MVHFGDNGGIGPRTRDSLQDTRERPRASSRAPHGNVAAPCAVLPCGAATAAATAAAATAAAAATTAAAATATALSIFP